MNRGRVFLWIGLGAILALAVAGCMLGVSVDQRLDSFLADLNSANWSGIYLNFHPDLTADYDVIKDVTWHILYPTDQQPYIYVDLDTSNTSYVTGRIVATGGTPTIDDDVVFVMALDGQDWQIVKFSNDGGLTYLVE